MHGWVADGAFSMPACSGKGGTLSIKFVTSRGSYLSPTLQICKSSLCSWCASCIWIFLSGFQHAFLFVRLCNHRQLAAKKVSSWIRDLVLRYSFVQDTPPGIRKSLRGLLSCILEFALEHSLCLSHFLAIAVSWEFLKSTVADVSMGLCMNVCGQMCKFRRNCVPSIVLCRRG